jgi:hypothetical protein
VGEGHNLIYRALRPIAAGEQLQPSYLEGPELLAPSFLRRRLLAARKGFECGCARCVSVVSVGEQGRELPCKCGGRTAPCGHGKWRCASCQCSDAPTAGVLAMEEALVSAFLSSKSLQNIEQAVWGGHWVWSAEIWARGLPMLREGVEGGDVALARSAGPILQSYFEWCKERWPTCPHFVSSRAAEVYACLAATGDAECAGFASRLCSPYLPALQYEYGIEDGHNKAMGSFFKSHCGRCGKASKNFCSRCKLVAYCGADCQRKAWKAHKRDCNVIE